MSEESESFLKIAGKKSGTQTDTDEDGFAANVLASLDDKSAAHASKVKKAYDISTLSPKTKEILAKMTADERSKYTGAFGSLLLEPVPEYIKTEAEVVFKNENNSYIVLGRDRPGNRETGYGGKGYTQCASIDLVTGRGAPLPLAFDQITGEKIFIDPNFETDAARIYISQKADIDEYFDLATGVVGGHQEASAIGIKADCVRIVGRQGIKIVTGGDSHNSQGQDLTNLKFGIDLIANNDDTDLQPLVKGGNMINFLDELLELIDNLGGILNGFLVTQMELNKVIGEHTHISPFFANPTLFSLPLQTKTFKTMLVQLEKVKKSILQYKANLAAFRENYLQASGDDYILSRYNFSN